MGLLRSIIWSSLCVALGVSLGTHSFSGRTAVEHAELAFKDGKVREQVGQALDSAKKTIAEPPAPTEKHSDEDKERVNRIIGRRKP